LKALLYALALVGTFAVTAENAEDVEIGRSLAQSRCAPCHMVGPSRRDELADAPPFEVIARKFPDSASLVAALRGPHRKMNFRPTQAESENIAAYIRSLAR
jgi:mono/diheme cytochrome c family protein